MAIYDNLPVFKDTYDLLLLFIRTSANMQRDFRYTIGQGWHEIYNISIIIFKTKRKWQRIYSKRGWWTTP